MMAHAECSCQQWLMGSKADAMCQSAQDRRNQSRNSCAKLATGWVITTISAIIIIHQQLATTISAIVIVLQQLAACAANSGFH